MAEPTFRCPACRDRLADVPGGLACAAGHRVDRAREGYVNLLGGGRRPAAGDSAAAVRARRTLLGSGVYAPVVDAVTAAVRAALPQSADRPPHVLDAGCGEGTYLAAVVDACGAVGWGVDVSKPAVRLAARSHREHRYAVASSRDLPFGDGVFDAVLSIFAPRAFDEFFRVLRPGASIVLASPGPDHLDGVRAAVGRAARETDVRRHVSGDGVPPPDERVRVRRRLELSDPLLATALVAMTPWGMTSWGTSGVPGDAVPVPLRTTIDVWVTRHTRHTPQTRQTPRS